MTNTSNSRLKTCLQNKLEFWNYSLMCCTCVCSGAKWGLRGETLTSEKENRSTLLADLSICMLKVHRKWLDKVKSRGMLPNTKELLPSWQPGIISAEQILGYLHQQQANECYRYVFSRVHLPTLPTEQLWSSAREELPVTKPGMVA